MYWIITQSAVTPTEAQIIAGTDENDLPADFAGVFGVRKVINNLTINELTGTPDTSYYIHFVHETVFLNQSSAISSAVLTTPDTIPPVLSNPTDVADGVVNTEGDGTVDTNEGDGTLYTVVTQSSTAPSAEQIIAGTDELDAAADFATSQAVSVSGTQNIAFTGLTA